ncbi:membrane protein insertion efficiency factor YidD [uncultured Desulfuromusa sp.]|uniref:membrane protein insertion efficiency factor YidD n=1 Tax=uncultured Desulfuromusa sp. TaxID=219183 RepID=UPI002AA95368|nr:membrane protein insertion efficiency factor YidD [uncultured Desulfuromusa sp.]
MKRVYGILILLLSLHAAPARADNWDPWQVNEPATEKHSAHSTDNSILQTTVQLFQKYISPVDGQRCAMYPTCSAYALQALRKHGPLIGVFMTVDRLYHEGDPIEQLHPINKWGYIRFYDPLENNDFWLKTD